MGDVRLTLREALASDRLEDFVRQEEARGVELANGSDLERALALLITQRRSEDRSFTRRLRKSSARAEDNAGNAGPIPALNGSRRHTAS
jgi:uncharacterized protein YehS (DUF1456 family)